MAAAAQGKGINQKSTETNTVTTTNNTNIVQSHGADSAAIISALAPFVAAHADPTSLIGGTDLAQGTPTTPVPPSGGGLTQQIIVGVVVAVAVSLFVKGK